MKKTFLMLGLAVSFMAASCTKDVTWDDDKDNGGGKPKISCEAMMPEETAEENVTTAGGINVMKAWIEGDNLKIEVGYSGCNKHDFGLHLTDNYIENHRDPSSIVLQLADYNGEQFCQAYFQETLCFDISQLKVGSHGTVGLKLQNHDNVSLIYKY